MANRRLADAHLQPKEFAFTAENREWADKVIARYPQGRQASAVIPLLWRAQEQHDGWLPQKAIEYVAEILGMAKIRVLEVATFYTMFLLSPVGKKAHVQVCGTTPCRLRGADALFEVCARKIHPEPLHVSADGNFSWEEVECLGRLRKRADGADLERHLRGSDGGEFREGARRLREWKARETGPADRSPFLRADWRTKHACRARTLWIKRRRQRRTAADR